MERLEVWSLLLAPFLPLIAAAAAVLSLLAFIVAFGAWRRAGVFLRDGVAEAVDGLAEDLETLAKRQGDDLRAARGEAAEDGRRLREEVAGSLSRLSDGVIQQLRNLIAQEEAQLLAFSKRLGELGAAQDKRIGEQHVALVSALKDQRDEIRSEIDIWKKDGAERQHALADLVSRSLGQFAEVMQASNGALLAQQKAQTESFETRLNALAEANQQRGEALKATVEGQLGQLRRDNAEKLEAMRATVDEKLQGTLEQRLGESFRLVSERLEAVHKGLGEVQSLATGVGDLKRVLTNVKLRGGWGEVQLGALLEQMLAPSQFVANAGTGDGRERVEFAVRLPGAEDGTEVLLPIDSKFPVEDYERLQAAAEAGDPAAVELASRGLEARIRDQAREISGKYINPPRTTDFAILFLPTEGLFAEVIRRQGLVDDLQRVHRIVVAGPTTLTALLSSLQMGFRTLAIQQRSGEVWQVLGAVKTEFGKFGPVLQKVRKKLEEATNHIDSAATRERAIQRKLRQVESVPSLEAARFFDPIDDELDGEEPAESSAA